MPHLNNSSAAHNLELMCSPTTKLKSDVNARLIFLINSVAHNTSTQQPRTWKCSDSPRAKQKSVYIHNEYLLISPIWDVSSWLLCGFLQLSCEVDVYTLCSLVSVRYLSVKPLRHSWNFFRILINLHKCNECIYIIFTQCLNNIKRRRWNMHHKAGKNIKNSNTEKGVFPSLHSCLQHIGCMYFHKFHRWISIKVFNSVSLFLHFYEYGLCSSRDNKQESSKCWPFHASFTFIIKLIVDSDHFSLYASLMSFPFHHHHFYR